MKLPVRPPFLFFGVAVVAVAIAIGTLGPPESEAPRTGGPFTLEGANGETVTDADFRGRRFLLFFGFASCPDVCPTTLATLSRTIDLLDRDDLEAVFVTLDPERDTPEIADAYARSFHPSIRGLSGERSQIDEAAEAFRVYHRRVELDGSAAEYTIDHSTLVFLVGPDGFVERVFSSMDDPRTIAAAFTTL